VFVSVTTVSGGGADVADKARMAGESMLSWLQAFEGYAGLTILADPESGRARIVTFWDSREAVERSERGRKQVRESMVAAAKATIDSVELFELVLEDRR
jgi:hypothetical protein